MVSKCGRLSRIIYDAEISETTEKISLDDLPGGPESFELCAKFCYGIPIDLNSSNISALRCSAEYLEMSEDMEEGNLIFKTEAFLSYVVLSSWRDSIVVLKTCETLSPWAENLQIVRRCSDSIAWKACSSPKSVAKASSPSQHHHSKSQSPATPTHPLDWWFDDVSILRIDHFVKVITAIKVKGMRFDLIGSAITYYASQCLPGFSDTNENIQSPGLHLVVADSSSPPTEEQRSILESLISILPQHKDSVSCGFLLKLLRMSMKARVSQALINEVEKRAGSQLDQASLNDLLIPAFSKDSETFYNVDLMQRLIEHFLIHHHVNEPSSPSSTRDGTVPAGDPMAKVARILDSYLTEIARERNLSLSKFQLLAEALPDMARTSDDGLYRAIDSYLKAHPALSEHERKRLCKVMDCQKLSIDACMHAAQNERLPIRTVVQVLFSEQVKIANAIAISSSTSNPNSVKEGPPLDPRRHFAAQQSCRAMRKVLENLPQSFQEEWFSARKDIKALKLDNENLKAKVLHLQNEVDALNSEMEKMHMLGKSKNGASSGWSTGWKKFSRLTHSSIFSKNTGEIPSPTSNNHPHPHLHDKPRRWRNSIS
eukprot:TRINITY_DN5950_c0_g1_i2.p1 TRINITY_DN5950_c0_g1~~TRINITY_DN5950_c0_g1_i2.p1  ORF type:complete len:598 (-),score=45.32 TRINITY_DN5950_c0_g1_i2:305-2098(-)